MMIVLRWDYYQKNKLVKEDVSFRKHYITKAVLKELIIDH